MSDISDLNYGWGVGQIQKRAYEDRYQVKQFGSYKYFAIFDGHGGFLTKNHVVDYCEAHLHERLAVALSGIQSVDDIKQCIVQTFIDFDTEMYQNTLSNGAVCTLVLYNDTHIYQVNLGDSRSIAFTQSDTSYHIVSITEDHNSQTTGESERVTEAGGVMFMNRVNGVLAITRAFGDFEFKHMKTTQYSPTQGPISAQPDIIVHARDTIQHIIMSSDAPYEDEAYTVRTLLELYKFCSTNPDLHARAQAMTKIIAGQVTDDTSMILVDIV